MKVLVHILLFCLIGSVVQPVQAAKAIISEFSEIKMSCHTDSMESMDHCADHSENQKDDCCGDQGCHCACCVHLVYFTEIETQKSFEETVFTGLYMWKNLYQHQFKHSVFHPPLV